MSTLTAPARTPIEVVTPIKPSEAIRLGCLLAPRQAFDDYTDGEGSACAAGAANLGWGRPVNVGDWPEQWKPVLKSVGRDGCPVEGCPGWYGFMGHLNDEHRWSRERIADWLEGKGL